MTTAIKQFLGAPDRTIRNPSGFGNMYLFFLHRVVAAEQDPDCIAARDRALARRKARA